MKLSQSLIDRSNGVCELCTLNDEVLQAFVVPTRTDDIDANVVVICDACFQQIQNKEAMDTNYFRFLTGSIWSEVSAVKVLSFNLLSRLKTEEWAQEAIDGAYLSEEELNWALSESESKANEVVHKDAYGIILNSGDSVFLTESLNVKGSSIMAAKGTKVAKIRLVPDNPDQIEGKIDGSTIVILTKFVRKGNS
ncbi:MAG: PhnA domain-containing protein [Saprospiraceae bacterium]|nr:PhnA domain-containing protein [Saprospiraceae bacterium]